MKLIAAVMSVMLITTGAAADTPAPQPVVMKFKDTHPFLLQFTDVVADTIGLPLLRDHAIESGTKEIRIWIGFGLVEPEKMVRIVLDKSGHISGESYLYYEPQTSNERDAVKFYSQLHKKCKVLATGKDKEVCVPLNDVDTMWATVYAELIKRDIWTLPDENDLKTPPAAVTDGVALVIETRDGTQYRAYSYSNPSFNKASEAHQAVGIMDALNKTGDAVIY